jgi:hypothetical protein
MNKTYLPELKKVKKQYKKDKRSFKKKMSLSDVLVGPEDSLKFVKKKLKNK